MSGRIAFRLGLLAGVVLVLALLVASSSRGKVLLGGLLFFGALALVQLVRWLSSALPPAPDFEQMVTREAAIQKPAQEYERLRRGLGTGERTLVELRSSLRPFVLGIVTARLGRGRGLDLELMPAGERERLLEPRTREILRSPHDVPIEERDKTWTPAELDLLVGELERL